MRLGYLESEDLFMSNGFFKIWNYSSGKNFPVFGQYFARTLNMVAQYNDDNDDPWKRLPNLNKGRYGHGSILVGDKTLVIGGWARESQE